jgi:hypothetical protein
MFPEIDAINIEPSYTRMKSYPCSSAREVKVRDTSDAEPDRAWIIHSHWVFGRYSDGAETPGMAGPSPSVIVPDEEYKSCSPEQRSSPTALAGAVVMSENETGACVSIGAGVVSKTPVI